jgi:hypothetical protein
VHWTTSPRSTIRLTRDITNHPLWNSAAVWARDTAGGEDKEEALKGALGKFRRRFGSGDITAGFMIKDGKT